MKKIIKKILIEQIEQEEKLYSLVKKVFNKDFDANIEISAQIFIDSNRQDFYLASGKKIDTGEECFNQPYCRCKFIKDTINWAENMMNNHSDYLKRLDQKLYNEKEKDDFIFELLPYNFMQYGLTGYESMYLYGRLFKELHQQYC